MDETSTYQLGASAKELARLRKQADTVSEEAHWLFDRLDIQPGWRVLDVGCGPVGVLENLARRVGGDGSVLGLDANATMISQARAFLAACDHTNIEVVHADAAQTNLPHDSFDLVHARLLLINIPEPLKHKVVSEMVALARPGGIIALQDVDADAWCCDPPHPAWTKLYDVFTGVAGDGRTGRRLPGLLRAAGAINVKYDAHAMGCPPGHLWRSMLVHFSDITRPRALQLGLATAEELDAAKAELEAHLADPNTTVFAPVLTQAWGRKPMNLARDS